MKSLAVNSMVAAALVLSVGCKSRSVASNVKEVKTQDFIDYESLSPVEALDQKYKLMVPHLRGDTEREILKQTYETLRWGKAQGKWSHIDMEDLMAHVRQEAAEIVDRLEAKQEIRSKNAIGTNVWNFHMIPANDLNGFVSLSVWQAVEVNYLEYGRHYDPTLKKLYEDFIVKYGFEGRTDLSQKERQTKMWAFKKKMKEIEGAEKAAKLYDEMILEMAKVTGEHPDLHVKVIADLIEYNFASYGGVNTPEGLRSYFWIDIQRNLNPDNWYKPVFVPNDKPPTPENGMKDIFAGQRGDYGKQIIMGNFYNDRGMIFWYAVTKDKKAIERLVQAWEKDPAKLRKKDIKLLREKNYLSWVEKHPEIYDYILASLPE